MVDVRGYDMNQILLTIGSDFDILVGNRMVGKVTQRMMNWGRTFELSNVQNQIIATARAQVFTLGTKIDVFDCNNQIIGSLQENVLESLFKIQTVYSILDGQGKLVGQSRKLDFFGTDISFADEAGRTVATLSRPYLNFFTDKWHIVKHNGAIDSRILFFSAAYKTAADSDRKSDSSSSSSSSKKR
jgi:uncharacterized protein YxjI